MVRFYQNLNNISYSTTVLENWKHLIFNESLSVHPIEPKRRTEFELFLLISSNMESHQYWTIRFVKINTYFSYTTYKTAGRAYVMTTYMF